MNTARFIRRAALRAAVFVLLWWAVTEGDPGAVLVGAVAVPVTTAVSLLLLPQTGWRWNVAGAAGLVPRLLWLSFRGSLDVARRAFDPRLPLAPAFVAYRHRVPGRLPRVLFASAVTLMPGTLVAGLGHTSLTLHVLDGRGAALRRTLEDLHAIEERVTGLFDSVSPRGGRGRAPR